MALLPKAERDPAMRLVALALAAGVPLSAYLATASPYGYWLDGGEVVSASVHLDILHPPGHPLASLLGKLMSWLPLGPIPLRVALGQAFCAALAAGLLFSAIDKTVRALGLRHDRLSVPLALFGTWAACLSYAFWFQAVRPEVYALQAMLVLLAVERAVTLEVRWPTRDVRPLYTAALALGLSLANHHLVGVLLLPALAPTLARAYRAKGSRVLWLSGAALSLGLLAYVYLPVRASHELPANLGDPSSLSRFFWVVSAQVYSTHTGAAGSEPLLDRLVDLGGALHGSLPLLVLGMAVLGMYGLARSAGARRLGFLWGMMLLANLAAPLWVGSIGDNPDILGYMMPSFAALGALAASFGAAALALLGGRRTEKPHFLLTVFALSLAVLGLAQLPASAQRATLAGFHATDDLDEHRRRALPTRAVVLLHTPQAVFAHWGAEATEPIRPDVSIVPLPFLRYPGMLEALLERDPTLRPVLRGYLLDDALSQAELQSLAAERPVWVEMDVRVPERLFETLVPGGLLYEVVDGGATRADAEAAAEQQRELYGALTVALGAQQQEAETHNQLLWLRYGDALFYSAIGAEEEALWATDAALSLDPAARELSALRELLRDPEHARPIDITPYRVGAARGHELGPEEEQGD